MDKLLKGFIPHLRCPITFALLKALDNDNLDKLNALISGQHLKHADGSSVKDRLEEALITEDEQYIYPVIDGQIVVLLDALAIVAPDAPNGQPISQWDAGKQLVQDFYDAYGWKKSDGQHYCDTVTYEDQRKVAHDYWSRCHLRLNRYFGQGKYILDVASGAIPNDEYLTYADQFEVRVCMDFSLLALQEAALRLNHHGIFIMGDMTNIPIRAESMGAVISMHTVYHVPKEEQTKAVAEAYRVLCPQGKAVIVYSWERSFLMYWSMKLWRAFIGLILRKGKAKKKKVNTTKQPELFINQQNYAWFDTEIKQAFHAQLKVYSSISRSFSRTFFRGRIMGKWLGKLIFWLEDAFPGFMGRYGQYPVFLLHRKTLHITSPQLLKKESLTTNY